MSDGALKLSKMDFYENVPSVKLVLGWYGLCGSKERVELKPIGVVHTDVSKDQIRKETKEVEAVVKIFPEFEEALEDLDGYSHLFIISYFHKLRPEQTGPLKR